MKIHCLYDKLAPIAELKLDPKNRNKHPAAQIERLAQILKYQGWRYAVKISNQTGIVRSGHGRVEAAKLNGWDSVPVVYQDYDNIEQEIADSIADNAIASWAELDLAGVNEDLEVLGPDFEIDMLGIESFNLDAPSFEAEEKIQGEPSENGLTKIIIHLTDEQHLEVMKKVQACCQKAELFDLTSFFIEAVNRFHSELRL